MPPPRIRPMTSDEDNAPQAPAKPSTSKARKRAPPSDDGQSSSSDDDDEREKKNKDEKRTSIPWMQDDGTIYYLRIPEGESVATVKASLESKGIKTYLTPAGKLAVLLPEHPTSVLGYNKGLSAKVLERIRTANSNNGGSIGLVAADEICEAALRRRFRDEHDRPFARAEASKERLKEYAEKAEINLKGYEMNVLHEPPKPLAPAPGELTEETEGGTNWWIEAMTAVNIGHYETGVLCKDANFASYPPEIGKALKRETGSHAWSIQLNKDLNELLRPFTTAVVEASGDILYVVVRGKESSLHTLLGKNQKYGVVRSNLPGLTKLLVLFLPHPSAIVGLDSADQGTMALFESVGRNQIRKLVNLSTDEASETYTSFVNYYNQGPRTVGVNVPLPDIEEVAESYQTDINELTTDDFDIAKILRPGFQQGRSQSGGAATKKKYKDLAAAGAPAGTLGHEITAASRAVTEVGPLVHFRHNKLGCNTFYATTDYAKPVEDISSHLKGFAGKPLISMRTCECGLKITALKDLVDVNGVTCGTAPGAQNGSSLWALRSGLNSPIKNFENKQAGKGKRAGKGKGKKAVKEDSDESSAEEMSSEESEDDKSKKGKGKKVVKGKGKGKGRRSGGEGGGACLVPD